MDKAVSMETTKGCSYAEWLNMTQSLLVKRALLVRPEHDVYTPYCLCTIAVPSCHCYSTLAHCVRPAAVTAAASTTASRVSTAVAGRRRTSLCSLRSSACILALSFRRGKRVSGTGTFRKAHSGSQPCLTEYTSTLSAGTAAHTCTHRRR
jgi:hypothetical protein